MPDDPTTTETTSPTESEEAPAGEAAASEAPPPETPETTDPGGPPAEAAEASAETPGPPAEAPGPPPETPEAAGAGANGSGEAGPDIAEDVRSESSITPPKPGEQYQPKDIVAHDDLNGTFADAIDDTMVSFDDGDLVKGKIVKVDKDEVLLDIGYKSEGVIPLKELSIRNDVDPNEVVSLGDEIEALVLTKEDADGRLILSKKRAQYERAWGKIEELKQKEEVVTGPVIEVVKGGLIIDIGLRGFLPASLVELRRVRDLQPYVGRELTCKIIELERNRNNVVLSRRAWLEETQKEQRDEFLQNLKPGERQKGTVSSVVNFGAFVDLGGMDGLVHVSELSWKHVDHPSSVVSVGDEVEVEVLDVDMERERISLSLKATQQDPWLEFANGHSVGELVYGRVTKLVPFGSFVQVGEGIEGLVHISEMAEEHVETPDQVVKQGEELWVKIIDIDLDRRRISLSIKQAAEGGQVAEEYRDVYGEHAFDEHGNYIGPELEGVHEDEGEGDGAAAPAEGTAGEGAPEGEPPPPPPPDAGEAAPEASEGEASGGETSEGAAGEGAPEGEPPPPPPPPPDAGEAAPEASEGAAAESPSEEPPA